MPQLDLMIQISVKSNSGPYTTVEITTLDLINKGEAAAVLDTQRHQLSMDSWLLRIQPLVNNALQRLDMSRITPVRKEQLKHHASE